MIWRVVMRCNRGNMLPPHLKVVNSFRKYCKMFPNGIRLANDDDP
jgi:hypothetical protein